MNLTEITLETSRLRLVPLTPSYASHIFAEYRDPVTRTMNYGPPPSVESVRERIEERTRDMAQGELLSLVVLIKDTDEFLGSFVIEDLNRPAPEMGGWLKASAHGKGYGREAVAVIKQWADSHLTHDHLVWPCMASNTPSRKLAESLGGHLAKEYEKHTAQGVCCPYVEYHIPRATPSRTSPV